MYYLRSDLCVCLSVFVRHRFLDMNSVFRNYYSEIGICKLEIVTKKGIPEMYVFSLFL
jgi:hypothetical protein